MLRCSIICGFPCVTLISCDANDPNVLSVSLPLIPLKLGNQWVMERTDSLLSIVSTRIDTFTVSYDTPVNGELWYAITSKLHWNITAYVDGSSWYMLRDDGLWNRKSTRLDFSDPFHVIKYSSEEGEVQIARSGLSATLVNRNAIYDVPGLGPISTVQYEIRLSSGYNVFDMDSAFPDEQLGTFEFEGEEIVTQHFSKLFGFVRSICQV